MFYTINYRISNDTESRFNYITCFDKNLETKWQRIWETPAFEYASGELELTPDGETLILVGATDGYIGFTLDNRLLLYYIDAQTGDLTNVIDPQAGDILNDLIYPNPAQDVLYLSDAAIASNKVKYLEFYAVTGGLRTELNIQANSALLSDVPTGTYIAVARDASGKMTGRQKVFVK